MKKTSPAILRMAFAFALALHASAALGKDGDDQPMNYGQVKTFLNRHTRVVELSGDSGARVAICPEYQGRVMTSTCGGTEGLSFGFVCTDFIRKGELDPRFNNYGGEERMWLSPEGGPFSLWFKPGVEQVIANWVTPPGLNEGVWEVSPEPTRTTCRMSARMKLENSSSTKFQLSVHRKVQLLNPADLSTHFGRNAARRMQTDEVEVVAYETVNTIINEGAAMTRGGGLVSIWILGMLNSSPKTVVIVPYQGGDESTLGPIVKSDYFGAVPAGRLKETEKAVLFRCFRRIKPGHRAPPPLQTELPNEKVPGIDAAHRAPGGSESE